MAMKTSLANISIECEPRVLNETTDRDREEENDVDLEIDEATDVQGEIAGTSNGQESAGSSELSYIITWSAKAMPSKKKIMNEVEFWNLLGIIYAFTRTTNRRRDLRSTVDGIFPAPKFGSRFGILRGRFEKLLKYLQFCPPEEFSDANDKWAPVRRLIDAFNKRHAAKFFPSRMERILQHVVNTNTPGFLEYLC
ncbi:hypothetical protein EMCRGX_G007970 [Ephydatia muelleri]